mmetsp:Transcript_3373/g.9288  ORF Transcript_3373/g.9288 Transcript_3373/m.9288 type:complete len:188 (-) Transcript_3373:310-873(-)
MKVMMLLGLIVAAAMAAVGKGQNLACSRKLYEVAQGTPGSCTLVTIPVLRTFIEESALGFSEPFQSCEVLSASCLDSSCNSIACTPNIATNDWATAPSGNCADTCASIGKVCNAAGTAAIDSSTALESVLSNYFVPFSCGVPATAGDAPSFAGGANCVYVSDPAAYTCNTVAAGGPVCCCGSDCPVS